MSKFMKVVSLLEDRVRRGDYALTKFPGERALALEVGVSRVTARKAVNHLIERGLILEAGQKGKLVPRRLQAPRVRQLAFLMPPVVSQDVQHHQRGVELAAASFGAVVRSVVYAHWSDVLIDDALKGFDGVFFMRMGTSMPEAVIRKLQKATVPVVSLDHDLSAEGIVSARLFPEDGVSQLLDRVAALGHRRIACLSSYPLPIQDIEKRIEDWQHWKSKTGLEGILINEPHSVKNGGGTAGADAAHRTMTRVLESGHFHDTAILCTALWTALGAMRAIEDAGKVVGRDISVCVVNDEELGPWIRPRLTSLQAADAATFLAPCVDWILRGGRDWFGPLLITPKQPNIFMGESTMAPPSESRHASTGA
jgi:DNA-binding LacI/PurR family transcriptional regulator